MKIIGPSSLPSQLRERDQAVATGEYLRKELEGIVNTYVAIATIAGIGFWISVSGNEEIFALRSEYVVNFTIGRE